ncbi:hypothetical protein BDM02DRAFT_2470956 [Thelephora ganbajun]|uniref:Uncharacterized protein n=1 Tax=Thelephora ganbajun TaxID=370292 RepID=A0ACB6YY77_THEGA|nr:hypothetical protein BDM02DRAFT_2470956 [Thelephora ganbajun]
MTFGQVQLKDNYDHEPCRIWKLIPAKSDTKSQPEQEQTPSKLPPYDGSERCTCSHHTTETSDDRFGTTVTEVAVTTTTTTVTTRKKYRVEGDQIHP